MDAFLLLRGAEVKGTASHPAQQLDLRRRVALAPLVGVETAKSNLGNGLSLLGQRFRGDPTGGVSGGHVRNVEWVLVGR